MDLKEITNRREEISRIAGRYPVTDLRVFGSVVRGESTDLSDVDFLIKARPGCSLLHLGGLLEDLQDFLGCRVDLVNEDDLKPRLRTSVLREAILL